MKKVLSVILAVVMLALSLAFPSNAEEVSVSAYAYVLYCPMNGEILLSDNADAELPMASTTKIMTTLITLEEAERDDRVITFTEDMIAEGSSIYLNVGEKLRLSDLAVGMMMQSGNDAANAAAISISGSVEEFADRMNERAGEIGMEHSSFVTPSGLDSDGHYSTARDMALLMAEAMDNSSFRDITSQTSMTVRFTEPDDKVVSYPNHNKLLKLYEGCIGGKTGYTDLAGRCLVTAAERDGLMLIAVTLNDGDDWNDHMKLYDYGFESYRAFTPDAQEYTVSVVGGVEDSVKAVSKSGGSVVLPRGEDDIVDTVVYLPSFEYAPIAEGDILGYSAYISGGSIIAEIPLYASHSVEYNDRRRGLFEYIKDLLNWHS